MAAEDELGDMVDKEMYEEERNALIQCLDALSKLARDDQRRVMECVKNFFGLPKHE